MSGDERKPDFSNVQSGANSNAPAAPKKADFSNVQSGVGTTAPTPTVERMYTVVKGDTLSKIAKTYYGNANKWKLIFEANGDQIKNADLIKPGQVLKIPHA